MIALALRAKTPQKPDLESPLVESPYAAKLYIMKHQMMEHIWMCVREFLQGSNAHPADRSIH